MTLKQLMNVYSNANAIEAAFDEFACHFFEQLDDWSLWKDFNKCICTQTKAQKEVLANAIFTLFPATVYEAKNSGLDNAKEFFDFVFADPVIARRNRLRLCSLLRDLEVRQKNNLSDDQFRVSASDLQELFEKAKAYDI